LHIDPPFIPPWSSLEASGGQQYRLYFLDGTGHITKSHEYIAEDDAAAVRIAEGWREGRTIELWCRARRVRRWDAD
jgi:hypothetical protein